MPMRHHFPRWIIGFYYPYPCTLDMGPSEYTMPVYANHVPTQ
eukprot:COSAG04_NODE_9263_length_881_cov_0.909207_1_plen_41_part_10